MDVQNPICEVKVPDGVETTALTTLFHAVSTFKIPLKDYLQKEIQGSSVSKLNALFEKSEEPVTPRELSKSKTSSELGKKGISLTESSPEILVDSHFPDASPRPTSAGPRSPLAPLPRSISSPVPVPSANLDLEKYKMKWYKLFQEFSEWASYQQLHGHEIARAHFERVIHDLREENMSLEKSLLRHKKRGKDANELETQISTMNEEMKKLQAKLSESEIRAHRAEEEAKKLRELLEKEKDRNNEIMDLANSVKGALKDISTLSRGASQQ